MSSTRPTGVLGAWPCAMSCSAAHTVRTPALRRTATASHRRRIDPTTPKAG